MFEELPPETTLPELKEVLQKSASGRIWIGAFPGGRVAGRSTIHSALESVQVEAAHV